MRVDDEFIKEKLKRINKRLENYYIFDKKKQAIGIVKGSKHPIRFVDENMKTIFEMSNTDYFYEYVPTIANKIANYSDLKRITGRTSRPKVVVLDTPLVKSPTKSEINKIKKEKMQQYKEKIRYYGIH